MDEGAGIEGGVLRLAGIEDALADVLGPAHGAPKKMVEEAPVIADQPRAVRAGRPPKQSTLQLLAGTQHENVHYESSLSERNCMGRLHYMVACPGWNKVTDKRVVYSRWRKSQCYSAPVLRRLHCYCDRQLDTFDADTVFDISAHQNLCQVCRGEGDIVLYRNAGADLSSGTGAKEEMVISDVANVGDVFQRISFELSKLNLETANIMGLGKRMGAVTWELPAGGQGPVEKRVDLEQELVYYDSRKAKRTWCGVLCQLDCCFQPEYKVTSERVMYTDWEWWHLCDGNPADVLLCPLYAVKACARDFSCCTNGSGRFRRQREQQRKNEAYEKREHACGCAADLCKLPVGRRYEFFDRDIVADVRAYQRCDQLCLNEGDLLIYVNPGHQDHDLRARGVGLPMKASDRRIPAAFGDGSDVEDGEGGQQYKPFVVVDVPEVFSTFDQLSLALSQMDLRGQLQNSIATAMVRHANPSAAV